MPELSPSSPDRSPYSRTYRVIVTTDNSRGAEGTQSWTAEIPGVTDCAVSGRGFVELESALRTLMAERLRLSDRDADAVELEWSVDETGF